MREAGPSGVQGPNRGANHNCQGPRCVCQRYENGGLAAAIMNHGRNNQEREDGDYQNAAHVLRAFQNRASNTAPQLHPNLNPNYQNPIDVIRNYNRRAQPPQQQQEIKEENIYERLDNDDEDENAQVPRNEPPPPNNQGNGDNYMYERINERLSCSNGGRANCRCYYKHHGASHPPAQNLLNDVDNGARNASQYDQPRNIYIDYSRLAGNLYQSSLSRLGRNCFSTENIAYASTRRAVQPLVYNCACPYCRHADTRHTVCHHCQNLHNRPRGYRDDPAAGSSRHYVHQMAKNCRCPFCRGDYQPYVKLPAQAALRAGELFKMECCQCRNPAGCCTCNNRGKLPMDSGAAIYFGRYLDWISRAGQSVNNPLYAMIHVGRMDRAASVPGNVAANGGNQSNPGPSDPGPSTFNGASSARFNEPSCSSYTPAIPRSVLVAAAAPSSSSSSSSSSAAAAAAAAASSSGAGSGASVCPVNRYITTERLQHTCDDSCIRGQSGSLAGICQFLGARCERTECNHGRLSVHWWFVNKWLPLWNSHNLESRSADGGPCMDEAPQREQREQSDSDDS